MSRFARIACAVLLVLCSAVLGARPGLAEEARSPAPRGELSDAAGGIPQAPDPEAPNIETPTLIEAPTLSNEAEPGAADSSGRGNEPEAAGIDDEVRIEEEAQPAFRPGLGENGEPMGLGGDVLGEEERAKIEEIVVTSQGRAQPLQEVAVSVAAFDADYMQALGAQNIKDIAQFTPNLEIRSVFSASNPTLFIRGVGLRDFNANSASSVAVYNDDVYMNSPAGQLAQLFDVQRIEVLRGPQGTLYGRNASAGAIRVIARKPTGVAGGYGRVTYGRFNQIELEGAAETPIIPDRLSLRIAGRMNRRDGITKNRCADASSWRNASNTTNGSVQNLIFAACFNRDTVSDLNGGGQAWLADSENPGFTAGQALSTRPPIGVNGASRAIVPGDIDKTVNNKDDWALRGILRFQPSFDSDWSLNLHGGQNLGQARQFQLIGRGVDPFTSRLTNVGKDATLYGDPDTIVGFLPPRRPKGVGRPIWGQNPEDGDPFAGDYNRTGLERLDLLGANLVGEMHFGDWKIRSISAWEWNNRDVDANVDANANISIELQLQNKAWQLSQEMRAYWDGGGDVTAQTGFVFLFENLDADNFFRTSLERGIIQRYGQKTYYGSAFGYATWELSELLSLEGGMRLNAEHKTFQIFTAPTSAPSGGGIDLGGDASDSTTVTKFAPTGDVAIHLKPRENVNIYFKYSRGWKGPHINAGAIGLRGVGRENIIEPVKPEEVNALELGFKTTFFDDRWRVNSAAFYYNYNNIQIFQLKNAEGGVPVQQLINANNANVFGVEIEAETHPLEGWIPEPFENLLVFASFGWLEAKYSDFTNTEVHFVGSQAIPVTKNFSGNRLINAPRFAFTGYAQWVFPLWSLGSLAPRFDWSFKDKVFFSPENFDAISQDPLWLLNLRVAYRTEDDAIEVAGFVRNLTDEVYRVDMIDLSAFRKALLYAMGDPRTYGVTFTFRF